MWFDELPRYNTSETNDALRGTFIGRMAVKD